jgi:chemotaxis protein MotA
MDILSIVGLVLAANAVLLGAILRGAGIMALVSTEAFMVVGVGTIAATCIQTPLPVMKHALKIFPWIVRPKWREGRR